MAEAARGSLSADRAQLGRQFSSECRGMVRSADAGARRFRCHGHILLHARAPGIRAASYQPAAGRGGIRGVLLSHAATLLACRRRVCSARTGYGARMTKRADAILEILAGSRILEPRVMIVVAHPDDETIGMGAQLCRFHDALLIHVTDGAPRDGRDAAAHGFRNIGDYALARRAELRDALEA